MAGSNKSKTIHGRPVSAADFRTAICEAFAVMQNDTGGVVDLLPVLGPEHDTPEGRRLLSLTLNNMIRGKGNKLKRHPDKRGLYTLSRNNFRRNGASPTRKLEDDIAEVMREAGGFATAAQILDVFDLRPHGEDEAEVRRRRTRAQWHNANEGDNSPIYSVASGWDYKRVYNVLRTSERIRQDYIVKGPRGTSVTVDRLYNLPQHELNALPLRGYFAGLVTKATYEDLGLPDYKDARDAQFNNVGDIFRTARKARKLTLLALVGRRGVAAALLDLTRDRLIDSNNRSIYHPETDRRVAEMRAAGASQDEVTAFRDMREDNRNGSEALADMLDRFERPLRPGSREGVNLHLRAPVSFYVALAAELGIDPVAATRGVLQIDVSGPRIVLEKEGPDWDQVWAREEARERTMEVRDGQRTSITVDPRLAQED